MIALESYIDSNACCAGAENVLTQLLCYSSITVALNSYIPHHLFITEAGQRV